MILDIFKFSIEHSIKDRMTFLKLSPLSLFSFLIIPFIIIEGYCYRITNIQLDSFINAKDPLPEFNDLKNLIIDGLKVIFVNFIYSLPLFIAILISFEGIIHVSESAITVNITESMLILIILFIIAFITFLFSKVAIAHMICEKSFKTAFEIKELIRIIKEIKVRNYLQFYIGYILLYVAIFISVFFVIELFASFLHFNHIGVNLYFVTVGLDIVLILLSFILVIFPLFKIFESRSIASIYNMRD